MIDINTKCPFKVVQGKRNGCLRDNVCEIGWRPVGSADNLDIFTALSGEHFMACDL